MNVYFFCILFFLLIMQGGFYPTSFLLVGFSGILFLIFSKRKIIITKEIMGLGIVAVAYLLSGFINGISYSTLNSAMLPLVCLIIAILFRSLDETEKDKLIYKIEILGIISSVAAIFMFIGIWDVIGTMNAGRLQFTFQYANVAGTWFATSFILARDSKNKRVRMCSYFNLIALLMSKSIGAILIFLLLQTIWIVRRVIKEHTKKRFELLIIYGFLCFVVVLVLSTRYEQGIYTFVERFIQSYDGIKVILRNYVIGIGPGNWQYAYPFYQSAQYRAGIIHNSYVQIGVDAGIIPMIITFILLVMVFIKYVKKSDCKIEAVFLIMLHSLIDFCLYFSFIDVLLIILLGAYGNNKEEIVSFANIKNGKRTAVCIIVGVTLCFSYYGTMKMRNMERYINGGNVNDAINIYKSNYYFMKNGYKENELYFRALLMSVDEEPIKEIEQCDKKSATAEYYELLACKARGNLEIERMITFVYKYPFNYDMICELTDIVEKGDYTDAEIERYKKLMDGINKKIKQFPAKWLNNQKEINLKIERKR